MLIGLASLAANHNLKTLSSKQQMLLLCLFFRISQVLAVVHFQWSNGPFSMEKPWL